MASNPFLAMSEDFTSAQPTEALNPFLTGDFGAVDTLADNPFAASNPFSDFGAPAYDATAVTTSIDFFNIGEPAITSATNFFTTALQDSYDYASTEPLFSTAPSNVSTVNTTSFFDTTIDEQTIIPTTCIAQKPTELGLTMTHTIASLDDQSHIYSSDDELKSKKPPVPSRPIAPETKDLIMSVTGHMDFTSSHLLDRIPPTRTPSPVSMRDLHSPSPTPEPVFGDLLGEDIKKEAQMSSGNELNLFDADDVVTQVPCTPQQNSSPSPEVDLMVTQASPQPATMSNSVSRETSPKEDVHAEPQVVKPPRPGPPARPTPPPPVRPARPTPPSKPPPPSVLPQRPPPIPPMSNVSHQPPVPPVISSSNDFSFFDAPAPVVHKTPTTKEGILSLYSTPKKQEEPKPRDFLTDDIPETLETFSAQPENSLPTAQNKQSPEKTTEQIIPEQEIVEKRSSIEFDKPQPMDITPNSEENPIEQTERESVITEDVHEVKPTEIAETVPTIPDAYIQPIIPTNESMFAPEPVVQETQSYGMHTTYEESQAIPNSYAAPESNPFAAPEPVANTNIFGDVPVNTNQTSNIFGLDSAPSATSATQNNAGFASIFGGETQIIEPQVEDSFDAFTAKFESTGNTNAGFDAFGGTGGGDDAWGSSATGFATGGLDANGFGADDNFDAFLSLNEPPPVPSGTPAPFGKNDSQESDEGNFNVFIKPREGDVPFDASSYGGAVPVLAPPPAKSPATSYTDSSPRVNPFDKGAAFAEAAFSEHAQQETQGERQRSGSQEDPPTPLFDEDTSQPLEDFPRIHYDGPGWEVQLRQPNKKKITGQRFWKKIFIRMVFQGDNPVAQLFNSSTDKEPFQELPLQACYSVSDIAAQQYDQYGKIFTVKLQYVFYKERPGVRPGQVTKAERITNKLSQFAAYAIQGDYQGVKEFGSDLKKLGLPVEHAPQVSQLFKIGSTNYEDMKQFSMVIEEALFRLNAHRDRALHYKMEEVQITAVDEIYVEQDSEGHVMKQIARVRLFFLGFLSGMPDVELGVNNMWRQGKEVVGRHDIIPVATEEWIRLEGVEFHSCIQQDEYQNTRIIRFKPPDACYIELMRFRVRPPKNRELPLQLKAVMCVTGNKVELRADVLVPGFTSRSLGQVPCEDVMIRFPIPECWIYLFRVEKHFRYGSVKSAHRRTGKIKGIERFLGAVDTLQESLIEVTSGQAKYEHQHRSIVWRMSRLPKEGQGAYTTHNLVCRMALTSYDQIPEKLAEWCYVEFTMPATQVSHTVVRSVSLQNHDSDEPPEKYVRYLARHEYKVGIEHTQGEGPNAYLAATIAKPTIREEPKEEVPHTPAAPSSDSDSD